MRHTERYELSEISREKKEKLEGLRNKWRASMTSSIGVTLSYKTSTPATDTLSIYAICTTTSGISRS